MFDQHFKSGRTRKTTFKHRSATLEHDIKL